MSVTIQLTVGGAPAPAALYDEIMRMEIEESSDQPGTLLLQLAANRTAAGDLAFVGDGTFEPMTNVALTVTRDAPGSPAHCIFDGYVLAWRLHLDRASAGSAIEVWAQDASRLMNTDDRVREWSGMTDVEVADTIFASYGFRPAAANADNGSPAHLPEGHTLVQRGTDLQFLRGLARRGGKLCRVGCTDTPGVRTGYFVTPEGTGPPAATITLADPETWTVDALDFDWDVLRPSEIDASQVDLAGPAGADAGVAATGSGLPPLDLRDYASYLGRSSRLRLTAAADAAELAQRTKAVLIESGFFARCTGEAHADRIGTILRVGDVAAIEGAGSLQSGNWLVWDVRHSYSPDSWKMAFTLVRNAMGPPVPGAQGAGSVAGALAGLAGAAGL